MTHLPSEKGIIIGSIATASRIFTQKDVEAYAALTGDYNPIHFDETYAEKTIFKRPIIHGPLVISLITTLFGTTLPGPGSIYLSHEVYYLNPVFEGDRITAYLEVISQNERNHIVLKTTCKNQDDRIVIDGFAKLKLM